MSNNVVLPATGTGTATPTVETIDTTGSGGPQRQSVTLRSNTPGDNNDVIGPVNDTAASSDTAPASINARLQRVCQRITSLIATQPAALTGGGSLQTGFDTIVPTSTLTRPTNTTSYAQNNLIASSTVAGSIVVPFFATGIPSVGSGTIYRARLSTNVTTGWGSATFLVELWNGAPTFTNGDGSAYAVATGATKWLGSFTFAASGFFQVGDGAYGTGTPTFGSALYFNLSTQSIYWTLKYTASGALTPISGQTLTLALETNVN